MVNRFAFWLLLRCFHVELQFLYRDIAQVGSEPVLPEALGERIVVDLQLCDEKILVGGHCHELRLREGERQAFGSHDRWRCDVVGQGNDVELGNVAVHGGEDDVALQVFGVVGDFEFVEGQHAAHEVRAAAR